MIEVDFNSPEFKKRSQKWIEKYFEKEKLRQQQVDDDPASETLYTYEIDVDTLEIESNSSKELNYDKNMTGYASYEEDCHSNRVYAESLVSENNARNLVYNFCEKFSNCMDKIRYNKKVVCGREIVCDCEFEEQICDCYQLSFR